MTNLKQAPISKELEVYVTYECRTLADLVELVEAVRAECRVARGRKVDDSEILLQTADTVAVNFTLETDGYQVYNLTVGA